MYSRVVWVIFQKEWTDLIRDKRTWISALIIPIVVVPMLYFLMSYSMNQVWQAAKTYIPFSVSAKTAPEQIQAILAIPGTVLVHPADPLQAIKQGTVRVAIDWPKDAVQNLQQARPFTVKIWYDPTNQKSDYAQGVIAEALDRYAKQIMDQRLQKAGLTREWLTPIDVEKQSVASKEQVAGNTLSSVIPLVLLMALASGGMAAAVDLIAGEKERGTMETLLASPVRASQLLTAKLLGVMLMSMASAVASLFSVGIIASLNHPDIGSTGMPFGAIQPGSFLLLVVVVFLSAAMFAGLELMISTVARTNKEAQTFMAPIVFAAMVPSYMLMPLNAVDIPTYAYMLPMFNNVALLKEIFAGQLVSLHAIMTISSSVIYVMAAIFLASFFFRKERFSVL